MIMEIDGFGGISVGEIKNYRIAVAPGRGSNWALIRSFVLNPVHGGASRCRRAERVPLARTVLMACTARLCNTDRQPGEQQ
jgi:hypothetical protein